VTREPCAGCMKMIVGAGIESVVFPTEVGDA
jgi:deoxycytidylate deaminase